MIYVTTVKSDRYPSQVKIAINPDHIVWVEPGEYFTDAPETSPGSRILLSSGIKISVKNNWEGLLAQIAIDRDEIEEGII
jgi:hypothetical protein